MSKSNLLQSGMKNLFKSVSLKIDQLQYYFQNIYLKQKNSNDDGCNLPTIPLIELGKQFKIIESEYSKFWLKYLTIERQYKYIKEQLLDKQIQYEDLCEKYKKLQAQLMIACQKIQQKQYQLRQLESINQIGIQFQSSIQLWNCNDSKLRVSPGVHFNNRLASKKSQNNVQHKKNLALSSTVQLKKQGQLASSSQESNDYQVPRNIHKQHQLNNMDQSMSLGQQNSLQHQYMNENIYSLLNKIDQSKLQQFADLDQSCLFFDSGQQNENLLKEQKKQSDKRDQYQRYEEQIEIRIKSPKQEQENSKQGNRISPKNCFLNSPLSLNVRLSKSIQGDEQLRAQLDNYEFKKLQENMNVECMI